MKRIYVDSSILVTILFNEPHAEPYRDMLNTVDEVVSSHLLEAEVYAASAREKIPFEEADRLLRPIFLIMPDRSLREEYRTIFSHEYCRGGDACHLATLLYLDKSKSEFELLTADKQQRQVAETLGIKIAQES